MRQFPYNLKKVLIFVPVLLGFQGCQSRPSPYVPTAVKQPGNGKLYVYWPGQRWGEKSGQAPEIQLDGVPIGVLRYKHFIEVETSAGTYELKLTGDSDEARWDGPARSFPAKVEAGENLFVRLMVKYDQETNRLLEGRMKYVVSFLPRAEREARFEMDGLKPIED
jgi:hypothetical protein